jgi:hypothetical protein
MKRLLVAIIISTTLVKVRERCKTALLVEITKEWALLEVLATSAPKIILISTIRSILIIVVV